MRLRCMPRVWYTFIGAFIGDVYGARIMGGREIGAPTRGYTRVFDRLCPPLPPPPPPNLPEMSKKMDTRMELALRSSRSRWIIAQHIRDRDCVMRSDTSESQPARNIANGCESRERPDERRMHFHYQVASRR